MSTSRRRLLLLCVTAAFAGFAPVANANLLPDAVKSLPVTAPSLGGASVGTAVLTVSYTDTTATATATAASVAVAKNQTFRLEMCVKAHSLRTAFQTRCDVKTVDTSGLLGAISVAAPTVTASLPRPATGGSGYFSYVLSVKSKQADGSFKEVASSWPAGGLGSAYVGVPARGSSTSPKPASEGVLLSNRQTGGINTGLPDSLCMEREKPEPPAPGAGVSTTGLGSDAPAYYEIGEPTGAHEGEAPVGVMLVIHGGGWSLVGPGAAAAMRSDADRWRARGWRTVNISYRACGQSFADARWFYDRARELWGSELPYCALGASAGGNLALLLAYARSSLACAIDQGGPTDAIALKTQSTPAGGTNGPRWLYNGIAAFTRPEHLVWWSPARLPVGGSISARVLFAVAANDPYVPYAQGTGLREKLVAADSDSYVDLLKLAAGDMRWVHGKVSADAQATYEQREEALVAPLVGTPSAH